MVGSGTPVGPCAVPGRPYPNLTSGAGLSPCWQRTRLMFWPPQGSLSPCLQCAQSFRLPPAPSQWPQRECSPGLQAPWRWWRGECGTTIWL